jgi:hypothetical protein
MENHKQETKNNEFQTSSKQQNQIDQKEEDPADNNIDESTLDKVVSASGKENI